MSNDLYLKISYFVVGAASAGLALATFFALRRSLAALTGVVPGGGLGVILRKLFLLGLVLPALTGFFSVAFRGCGRNTYQEIIADRTYLVAKNKEQLSASLFHLALALLAWGLVLAVAFLATSRRPGASAKKTSPPRVGEGTEG